MKNVLKFLAVMIVIVMTVAAVASCQPSTPATTTAADSKTEPAVTTAAETETEAVTTEEVTTEEVTTEPETTEEETEEPQKELYDVFRWDFNDASDLGWASSNATIVEAGEDGTMHLTVKAGDPNISTKKIPGKIECDDVEYFVMRVKNKTDSYSGQLFISTSDSPGPAEAYSYKFDYEFADEDDEWEIIEIDTLDIPGWTGQLRSLRLDYSDGGEGECFIDYIALQTTNKDKAGSVDTETEPDPRAGKQVLFKYDFTKLTADDMYLPAKRTEEDPELEEEEREKLWNFSNGVGDAYVEDGHLVLNITGIDPFMGSPVMEEAFDCEAVSAIVIKICNKTETPMAQLFFVSDAMTDYSAEAQVRFVTEHSGADNTEWEEVIINPKECPNWYGQLIKIRIDPTEASEGIVLLEYCELYG